jgi:hypothetical protein
MWLQVKREMGGQEEILNVVDEDKRCWNKRPHIRSQRSQLSLLPSASSLGRDLVQYKSALFVLY